MIPVFKAVQGRAMQCSAIDGSRGVNDPAHLQLGDGLWQQGAAAG